MKRLWKIFIDSLMSRNVPYSYWQLMNMLSQMGVMQKRVSRHLRWRASPFLVYEKLQLKRYENERATLEKVKREEREIKLKSDYVFVVEILRIAIFVREQITVRKKRIPIFAFLFPLSISSRISLQVRARNQRGIQRFLWSCIFYDVQVHTYRLLIYLIYLCIPLHFLPLKYPSCFHSEMSEHKLAQGYASSLHLFRRYRLHMSDIDQYLRAHDLIGWMTFL